MSDETQKKEHGGIPTSSHGIEVEYSSDPDRSGFDQVSTKKLLRKIDWTLIPFLALLYLLSFLDRTNIGNARLAGIEADLGMAGLDYNVVLAVFFPFYIASEIPSNLAMKKFRPSIWIPCIMIVWGIVCTLMGLVTNHAGLLACRMALGLAEGGLFPGINYYITLWYRRHECGFRMAIFFSAATAAGAFGGLLARGIVEMDGIGGKPGWAWIFILEGLATLVVAFAAFFVMNDYPSTAKFLTIAEKEEVTRRLEQDRSALADEFDMKYFWDAIKDWKIWVHMFITIGIYTPLYSYSLFLPTIVRTLGYSNETAQLMTVPPYVVACVVCVAGGYVADRHGQRGIYMIGFGLLSIVGFVMLIASHNNTVKYIGCFLAAAGVFPNVPQGVAWNGNNIGGSVKRGVGIAMHIGFGNLGGMIAGFMFQSKYSPEFYPGYGAVIGFLTMSLIGSIFMTTYLRRENARRDREYKSPSEYTVEEMMAERGKGDDATFFRYTI
ncbi:major facilitator superfamily transporter [Ilyonectria destructans]|nr:major facilitator superfamily transporter [Ilyonectria destructans]